MTTKASTKQTDVAIQIDPDGTCAGIFANGDPVLSYVRSWTTTDDGEPKRQPDEWLLTFPGANGSVAFHTGVLNKGDIAGAETKAREHLLDVGFKPQGTDLEQFGNEPEPNGW